MNFENIHSKKLYALLTTTVAALAISGCSEASYTAYKMPKGTIDLGIQGRDDGERHSFLVPSREVGEVACAVVHSDAGDIEMERRITPADNGYSQVDCLYDSWDMSVDDMRNAADIPVAYIK